MHEYLAFTEYVVDGDSVDVIIDLGFKINARQRIRLAGIDAPERGQPGYVDAKMHLHERLLNKVATLRTTKVSKWGYYLGDFYVDGIHINQEMIILNLAKPYAGGTKE